jgi:hypothetical protein
LFHPREAQYKYHVSKKWKFRKNISSSKKEALCKIRQTRAEAGKSTTFERHQQGKPVEEKRLRRHLKDTRRRNIAMNRSMNEDTEELQILSGSSFLLGNSM